jgi:hyperosmotically inducible periplasmic protein
MILRTPLVAAMLAVSLLTLSGCAVTRGQETVGAYVDDTGITTRIKALFFENKDVAGSSISVETLNGTVMLSGFAKSLLEKQRAETIARSVSGVRSVKNEIAVRP